MARFEVREAADGSFYWRLRGDNGEIVATSETYTRRTSAERGARDVAEVAAKAKLGPIRHT